MDREVCRSIMFINYHIPVPVIDEENEIEYSAVGFFDGMNTERISVTYGKDDFKPLWEYSMRKMKMRQVSYSYQNTFAFSDDGWNSQSDEIFWSEDTNKRYPLTFVTFFQLKDYKTGQSDIKSMCKKFSKLAEEKLKDNESSEFPDKKQKKGESGKLPEKKQDGIVYSYYTVDKNDFVVCLKCMHYEKAVEVIKELHSIEEQVIYSYAVFVVSNKVLSELSGEKYPELFEQSMDSICLKGIANSTDQTIRLDRKYRSLCDRLVEQLYGNDKKDNRLYDILGDDDFRFIARKVNLGNLLLQFAPGGLLCYTESAFRFYLFSSSLVINTDTPKLEKLGGSIDEATINSPMVNAEAPRCNQLQGMLEQIIDNIYTDAGTEGKEEKYSCLFAIWQLLQSLKALELAPTKKYDFWSLYDPLSMLIQILSRKMNELSRSKMLHEFIHKISMTLHGTLRTDIQFFQIRDFNVIVHYAPAKLRAFYSLWVVKVRDFYNALSAVKLDNVSDSDDAGKGRSYSFVFSPGMVKEVSVRQLYEAYEEKQKLMLITSPERYLYFLRWTPLILAHEVSHFVGRQPRSREARHSAWLECCVRVLVLEEERFRYDSIAGGTTGCDLASSLERAVAETSVYDTVTKRVTENEKEVRKYEQKSEYPFHSRNSIRIIRNTFRKTGENDMEHLVSEDSGVIQRFMQRDLKLEKLSGEERYTVEEEIRKVTYGRDRMLLTFWTRYENEFLQSILALLKYLTVEGHADLIMVLSLELFPECYLRSFVESTVRQQGDKGVRNWNSMLIPRVALVTEAVRSIVNEKPNLFETQFVEAWSGDPIRKMANTLPKSEDLFELAAYVWKYQKRCRETDYQKIIRCYKPTYNREEKKFVNTETAFLQDNVIWNLLNGYMLTCAEVYVAAIEKSEKLRDMQRQLKQTYEAMTGSSIYTAVQAVENFLESFEQGKTSVAEDENSGL